MIPKVSLKTDHTKEVCGYYITIFQGGDYNVEWSISREKEIEINPGL